jgi:hypothetical protein
MGTLYFAVCHDCAEVFCIGKFWEWRVVGYDTLLDELERETKKETEDLFDYFNSDDVGNIGDRVGSYRNDWIANAARILAFLSVHNGHRISIVDEHDALLEEGKIADKWRSGVVETETGGGDNAADTS